MRIIGTLIYALIIAIIDIMMTGKIHYDQVVIMVAAYVFLMLCIHMSIANHDKEVVSWFEKQRTRYLQEYLDEEEKRKEGYVEGSV